MDSITSLKSNRSWALGGVALGEGGYLVCILVNMRHPLIMLQYNMWVEPSPYFANLPPLLLHIMVIKSHFVIITLLAPTGALFSTIQSPCHRSVSFQVTLHQASVHIVIKRSQYSNQRVLIHIQRQSLVWR